MIFILVFLVQLISTIQKLPFRVLAREHGADLCYSPMIHARLYAEARNEEQRGRMFETCEVDR